MISCKDAANAAGGKTARACDSCVRRRARWFCAADDAFLCQVCDAAVHSANTLARRHQRVRLQTAICVRDDVDDPAPSWHHGFTRKARTPRHAKSEFPRPRPAAADVVPEIGADDAPSQEEISDDHFLCRVPILAPGGREEPEAEGSMIGAGGGHEMDRMTAFLSPDTDLTDFAADVEVLLGKGLEECCGMEEIGLAGNYPRHEPSLLFGYHNDDGAAAVKVKDEETAEGEFAAAGEPRRLGFDGGDSGEPKLLRLDYEAVIAAWAGQGLPWMNGDRPVLDSEDCWPDCMGGIQCGNYEESGGMARRHGGAGDGGREARVSRYREKRRTRLFAKKIRYEVRKVNAEKRPRMKGRFVKRASFLGQSAAAPPSLCVANEGDLHPGLRLRL